MKISQKILSALLVMILIAGAVWCVCQGGRSCCLCSSFRYHAPCLIDLETGKLMELDLYFPHPTKVAELADPQPHMSTFSFVHLGGVTGTKLTDSKRIEMDIPRSETTTNPALCKKCRLQLDGLPVGRYVLADLYNSEDKQIIQMQNNVCLQIRCYEITIQEDGVFNVVIQGTL